MPIDMVKSEIAVVDAPVLAIAESSLLGDPTGKEDESFVFGTFLVGETEFALSVTDIKEVVNEPPGFTRILPSPDYFCGVFNLRGFVVPVVDLRYLLGLPKTAQEVTGRKVAIIEHGQYCFGLLVDEAGDVFTVKRSERHLFADHGSMTSVSIISGVFMRDQGRKTVQIIDPAKVLGFDQIPSVKGSLTLASNKRGQGRKRQCLSFSIGDCACAFDMTCIKEVVDFGGIENPTLASWWTLGTIDLRGTTVPVVDLQAFLNDRNTRHADGLLGKEFKLIVLTVGSELLSFLVDSIKTIVPFHDEDIISFPPVGLRRGEMLKGGLTMQDSSMVLLIDHERVQADAGLLNVTAGLRKLFHEKEATTRADHARNSSRTTYITFSIEGEFALDIRHVKEVLNFPDLITRPPNIPFFMEGVVNLRGDLIPIINPRRLYSLDPVEARSTRLMIFSDGEAKYGLMVDKVGAIVTVGNRDTNSMAPFIDSQSGNGINRDVKEWLLIGGDGTQSQSLSILDLSNVLARCTMLTDAA